MLAGAMIAAFALNVGVGTERLVQITDIDFATGEITITNLGPGSQPLDGFRFCSNDNNEVARYSGAAGLNGITLAPGGSLIIHFNNDSPGGADRIDRLTLGGTWATPLGPDAYALGLYFPPISFGNGATMGDFVQWSIGGVPDLNADFRTDEAVNGGVWTDLADWVPTTSTSLGITLNDLAGNELHGPTDYTVNEPGGCGPECDVIGGDADVDDDCDVDISDLANLLANFGSAAASHNDGDTDFDGDVDLTDLANILGAFGVACP